MRGKKGQVTLFIFIALLIVGALVVYQFFPEFLPAQLQTDVRPTKYLQECISPHVEEITAAVYTQGGYIDPTHSLTYRDTEIQYLCYTDANFEPCLVMQPLLRQHVENELEDYLTPIAQTCVRDLEAEYESRGFTVQSSLGDMEAEYVPGTLELNFDSTMTITGEGTQQFDRFGVSIPSEMYNLLLTATNIIQFESVYGDSETLAYMQFYPDLKVEKIKRDEDTVYILTNVLTDESFTFATRSLVWPAGYGANEL